ncbi:MAG: hypothetical protein LUI60_06045 [Clostridia bacterium]|nr:hypothetical protein [Clostridia bacterium]
MFDWFWEFLYSIFKYILYLIDFIVDVFRILAGLNSIEISSTESEDLLTYLLSSYTVTRSFLLVVSLSVILLVLFTIIAIIRKQYLEEREQRSIAAILGSAMKSSLMFILVPVIMIAASTLLVTFVQQFDLATNPYSSEIYSATGTVNGYSSYSGYKIGGILLYITGYDSISGSLTDAAGFMTGSLDYMDLDTVELYYKVNSSFNWFLGYLSSIVVLVLFIKSLFTFVERIFAILGLYLIAPVAASSSVLDGGARFKSWRDEVINRFLISYSIVLTINLYFIVIPMIMDLDFGLSSNKQIWLIRLFFIVGGAFAVNKSMAWFGNIINSGAGSQALAESDAAGRGLWGATRSVVGGATRAAVGTVRGAARAGAWGYNAVKSVSGFTTPLDRLKHRAASLRETKLKTRDEDKAKRWQDNFYAENPHKLPEDYKPNFMFAGENDKQVRVKDGELSRNDPKTQNDALGRYWDNVKASEDQKKQQKQEQNKQEDSSDLPPV